MVKVQKDDPDAPMTGFLSIHFDFNLAAAAKDGIGRVGADPSQSTKAGPVNQCRFAQEPKPKALIDLKLISSKQATSRSFPDAHAWLYTDDQRGFVIGALKAHGFASALSKSGLRTAYRYGKAL